MLLHACLVVFPGCSTKSTVPVQNPANRYNIVLIVSDALRQDILGCYGGAARTPNIDALAGAGVLFENPYSTSPWTVPSAVSMFTGNYACTYGHTPPGEASGRTPLQVFVPHGEYLFAEALQQLGYANIMAIENVNASIHNNLQGFQPLVDAPTFDEAVPRPLRERIERIAGGEAYASKAFENAFVVLKHLLSIPPGRRFFLLHWILDPHYPYEPAGASAARLVRDDFVLPKEREHYMKGIVGEVSLAEEERRFLMALYRAEVESVDERVGYIMKVLAHRGLLDSTYIVFTSDHGEQFGDHGLYGHGGFGRGCHYYEGLVRVPLIIAGPGLPAGARVASPVSLLGLMPTLSDLLGITFDRDMQGGSFLPAVRGSAVSRELYFDDIQEHNQSDALLSGRHKLIAFRDGTCELYDVIADSREENDLADSRVDLRDRLAVMLERIRNDNGTLKRHHVAMIGDSLGHLPVGERRAIIRQLRSLGYLQ